MADYYQGKFTPKNPKKYKGKSSDIYCEICASSFDNYRKLSCHIRNFHKLNSKEYYDLYVKKENDGQCKSCGKETRFESLGNGYYHVCSKSCGAKEFRKLLKEDTEKFSQF
jgi:hypothetical protein